MLKQIILKEKTGASVWNDRANANDPASGAYSLAYAFASGIHAIKTMAEDEAGNTADSAVILFESGSTRKCQVFEIVDDVSPQAMTLTTTFAHTNDLRPKIRLRLSIPDLTSNGESAVIPNGAISEMKLYYAWKAYATPETIAPVDFAQEAIGTHASASGQGVLVSSSFVRESNTLIAEFTPSFDLIAGRIYTFGGKWKDTVGTYSAGTDTANLFSICVDTVNPVVTITNPINGYIYVGAVATVAGNVSDTLV